MKNFIMASGLLFFVSSNLAYADVVEARVDLVKSGNTISIYDADETLIESNSTIDISNSSDGSSVTLYYAAWNDTSGNTRKDLDAVIRLIQSTMSTSSINVICPTTPGMITVSGSHTQYYMHSSVGCKTVTKISGK